MRYDLLLLQQSSFPNVKEVYTLIPGIVFANKLYILTPRKLMERNDNPEKQLLKLIIMRQTIEDN